MSSTLRWVALRCGEALRGAGSHGNVQAAGAPSAHAEAQPCVEGAPRGTAEAPQAGSALLFGQIVVKGGPPDEEKQRSEGTARRTSVPAQEVTLGGSWVLDQQRSTAQCLVWERRGANDGTEEAAEEDAASRSAGRRCVWTRLDPEEAACPPLPQPLFAVGDRVQLRTVSQSALGWADAVVAAVREIEGPAAQKVSPHPPRQSSLAIRRTPALGVVLVPRALLFSLCTASTV